MMRRINGDASGRRAFSLLLAVVLLATAAEAGQPGAARPAHGHLGRAKVFLAAGDYRHAIEACQRQVEEFPAVESYVYLTYAYQALEGYLEHLAKHDRWVQVGQLYLSLASRGTEDLVDPPDVLARIAKEVIQDGVRQHADVSAAMAARLDEQAVARLWKQQTAHRRGRPEDWWFGVPAEWDW
jgi:hypothetical protein